MVEEKLSQKLRLENINKTRNYFFEEIKQKDLMSRRRKTFCEL